MEIASLSCTVRSVMLTFIPSWRFQYMAMLIIMHLCITVMSDIKIYKNNNVFRSDLIKCIWRKQCFCSDRKFGEVERCTKTCNSLDFLHEFQHTILEGKINILHSCLLGSPLPRVSNIKYLFFSHSVFERKKKTLLMEFFLLIALGKKKKK